MNLISALGAYFFFENKLTALIGDVFEDTKQLSIILTTYPELRYFYCHVAVNLCGSFFKK